MATRRRKFRKPRKGVGLKERVTASTTDSGSVDPVPAKVQNRAGCETIPLNPSAILPASERSARISRKPTFVRPGVEAYRVSRERTSGLIAWGVGILVNIIAIVLFLLISAGETYGPNKPLLVSVQPIEKPEGQIERDRMRKTSLVQMDSAASAASASALQSNDQALSTLTAQSLSQLAIPSFSGAGGFQGDGFSTGTEIGFGQSVGLGRSGYGRAMLAFGAVGVGDGSNLIVVADVSGSMRVHNEVVNEMLERDYPGAKKFEVLGCSIVENSDFLVQVEKIVRVNRKGVRRDLFFICDLQDQVDEEGINQLTGLLASSNPHYHFHVISFQKEPSIPLMSLIKRSKGSFTLNAEKMDGF